MQAGKFLLLNGKLVDNTNPVLEADNRSFRYGDGFFETIRWEQGTAFLWTYHVARFFNTLTQLSYTVPKHWDDRYLSDSIALLVKKNKHDKSARIRCTVFRGEGGLLDANNHQPHLMIQSWQLSDIGFNLNLNGLDIGVYKESIKAADYYSSFKTNSALTYIMAAIYAKKNKYNDAILLNQWQRVADSTIANIFYIDKENSICTPPLSEGGVSGVMRRFLIEKLADHQVAVQQRPTDLEDIAAASNVFLTNAIRGIQWVKSCNGADFSPGIIPEICKKLFS